VRWKQRVLQGWPQVRLALADTASPSLFQDEALRLTVAVELGSLVPQDIVVECVFEREITTGDVETLSTHPLFHDGQLPDGRARFHLDLRPPATGLLNYQIRAYPWHPLLAHRFELGCMRWL